MSHKLSDEISLIKACSQGDHTAFKKIYNHYKGKMFSICLRYMNTHDEAQDVLQDGFIKVYHKISTFSFAGSFEGWMKRIFVHTCIEFIRKQKQHEEGGELTEMDNITVSEMTVSSMDADKLIELIKELPKGYRTVFNMYVIDGYSHKQISDALQISESTSKTQLFKARKQLQIWLKGWFE